MTAKRTDAIVTVLVADEYLDRFDEVVRRLSSAGVRVIEVMPDAGVITGQTSRKQLRALGTVPGVANVEESRHFQGPPPDSPVQ